MGRMGRQAHSGGFRPSRHASLQNCSIGFRVVVVVEVVKVSPVPGPSLAGWVWARSFVSLGRSWTGLCLAAAAAVVAMREMRSNPPMGGEWDLMLHLQETSTLVTQGVRCYGANNRERCTTTLSHKIHYH